MFGYTVREARGPVTGCEGIVSAGDRIYLRDINNIEQKSLADQMNIKGMDGVQISGFNGWVSH